MPSGQTAQIKFPVLDLGPASDIILYSSIEGVIPIAKLNYASVDTPTFNSTTNVLKMVSGSSERYDKLYYKWMANYGYYLQ